MLRWDITTRSLDQLDTFAMAMLASIGDLPDTIMDRAVVVWMRRRALASRSTPTAPAAPRHPCTTCATGSPTGHATTSASCTRPPPPAAPRGPGDAERDLSSACLPFPTTPLIGMRDTEEQPT
jgi:hypothetical protein